MKITYRKPKRQGRVHDDALPTYKVFKLPIFDTTDLKKEYLKEGVELSNEELQARREALNFMHEIAYHTFKNIIQIKEDEESNIIHPSEYRRAS